MQRAKEKPEEFWGELAEKELFWFEKWTQRFRVGPAVREVVRRRQDERLLQLPGPAPGYAAQEQSRASVGRRAGRPAHDFVLGVAPAGVPLRERAEGARLEGRRSRGPLHAHGAGIARGDAGVRAARNPAQRGVRRFFRRSAEASAFRTSKRRSSSPPMAAGAAAMRFALRTRWMRRWRNAPPSGT